MVCRIVNASETVSTKLTKLKIIIRSPVFFIYSLLRFFLQKKLYLINCFIYILHRYHHIICTYNVHTMWAVTTLVTTVTLTYHCASSSPVCKMFFFIVLSMNGIRSYIHLYE